MDFHVFVLVSTIIYYILLRKYKQSTLTQRSANKSKSSLLYVLFVPLLLYSSRYFFPSLYSPNSAQIPIMGMGISPPSSPASEHTSIISSPYPLSSS